MYRLFPHNGPGTGSTGLKSTVWSSLGLEEVDTAVETGVFSTGCTAVVSAASGVEDVAVLSGVSTTGRTAVTIAVRLSR